MQSRRFIIRLHTDEIRGENYFFFTAVSWINGLRDDVYFFYFFHFSIFFSSNTIC